ncbi:SERTA domain-containing protein 3 [Marasmius crinis-equi]|uniref:SERTA domain-containing protein 3 n=1 Tax=Marasmius crinis-equi TaxID=585013 RepID=A0ABR3FC64_9AGAR
MPAQKIFVGQRAQFFTDRKSAYAEAVRHDTKKDFLANAQREFFNRWPPLLPLSVELDQATLDAVDDNVVASEFPVPVEEELEAEEYRKKKQEYDEYRKKLEERKGQIARRFKSDWEEDNTGPSRDPNDPWNLLLLLLNGTLESKKPRLQPAVNVWYQENKDLVKESLVKKGETSEKKKKGGGKKDTDAPNRTMGEARKIFEKLDAQVQQVWKDKAAAAHKKALEDWNRMLTMPPSTEPEDRQRCINRLVRFVKPIIDGIAERTGLVVTLIAGGPEPQDGGRLNCVSVHSGTTAGDIKMDWARAELQVWRNYIFPSLARFCRKVFSVEECRSRALPTDFEMDMDADAAGDDGAHVIGADLEAAGDQGVECYQMKGYGGIGAGRKGTQGESKPDEPTATTSKGTSAAPATVITAVDEDPKAATQNQTSTTKQTSKPRPKPQPKRSARARARTRTSGSSPTRPAHSLTRSPSRSPSPAARSRLVRGQARARATVSSPIHRTERSPSSSPSLTARDRPVRGRARTRMTVSSPIHQNESPQASEPALFSAPVTPRHHSSPPPSPIRTPIRRASLAPSPLRTPIQTPSLTQMRRASLPPSPLRTPIQTPFLATPSIAQTQQSPILSLTDTSAIPRNDADGEEDTMVVDSGGKNVFQTNIERGMVSGIQAKGKEPRARGRTQKDAGVPKKRAASGERAGGRRGKKQRIGEGGGSVEESEGVPEKDAGATRKRAVSGEPGGGRRGKKQRVEETEGTVSVGGSAEGSEGVPVLPKAVPDYVACTFTLAMKDNARAVPGFETLVSRWLGFEAKAAYVDTPRLKTTKRPEWVGLWFGRHRNPAYEPEHNAGTVLDQFWAWWRGLQPEWREFTKDNRPVPEGYARDRQRTREEWDSIRRSGPNGLSSVVACLAFIAARLPHLPTAVGRDKAKKIKVGKDLGEAVRDVTFVIEGLGV